MWSDNEADVDLLGFDFLVDELMVALTQERLLPLTLGLLGEWGSGKSSLLKIVASQLEAENPPGGGHYVVVPFSPWQFEGYDDIKIALMDAVLARLQRETTPGTDAAAEVGVLRRLAQRLRRPAALAGRAVLAGTPVAAGMATALHDPALAPVATAVVQQAAAQSSAALERMANSPVEADGGDAGDDDVASFRSRFEALVDRLENVRSVVVLVDDLDRCLPDTVVDTFEGIRLFLHVRKSAYVIAAHPKVVEAAIDARYPGLGRPGASGLGAEYLEKMLQFTVTIPTLSAPEAETYMQLLLAQLHLEEEAFGRLLAAVSDRRRQSVLAVALNPGLAMDTLGRDSMPVKLLKDMKWAGPIAPLLGSGLRGNPRQIKRFMNTVTLRLGSAHRRGTNLDPAVLAKLLVLEGQYLSDFQHLFSWQVRAAGAVPELAAAERHVRSATATRVAAAAQQETEASPDAADSASRGRGRRSTATPEPAVDPEIRSWAEKPHVAQWLALEPALGGLDLGPYFTYARAKLTINASAARLPAALQELLGRLQSEVDAARRRAARSVAADVPPQDLPVLMDNLLERVLRDPDSAAMDGALEVAEQVPGTVSAVCQALAQIPLDMFPRPKLSTVVRRLPAQDPEVTALLDGWVNSGHQIGEAVARLRAGQRR